MVRLAASEPLQWVPILAAVLFASRGQLRFGFVELYLLAATALHVTAMLKTGSSTNYLLEPMFALLLLAATRWPRETAPDATPARSVPRSSRVSGALAALFAVALALTAVRAVLAERPMLQGLAGGSAGAARVSEFEGHPLVDPLFFPAILERGGRPWLNDPYAFGALEEIGRWDPSRLVSDLEGQRVPFALTMVDPGPPAPAGVGTRELVMAYFWRSRPVWTALQGAYSPSTSGPITVWLPREEPQP